MRTPIQLEEIQVVAEIDASARQATSDDGGMGRGPPGRRPTAAGGGPPGGRPAGPEEASR